jgi:hypothetical protein
MFKIKCSKLALKFIFFNITQNYMSDSDSDIDIVSSLVTKTL